MQNTPKEYRDFYWKSRTDREVFRDRLEILIKKLIYKRTLKYNKYPNQGGFPRSAECKNFFDPHVAKDCCPYGGNTEFKDGIHTCFVCRREWIILGMYGYIRRCCWKYINAD